MFRPRGHRHRVQLLAGIAVAALATGMHSTQLLGSLLAILFSLVIAIRERSTAVPRPFSL